MYSSTANKIMFIYKNSPPSFIPYQNKNQIFKEQKGSQSVSRTPQIQQAILIKMAHICCAELISCVGSQLNTMSVKDSILRTTTSPSRYLHAIRVEVSNHYFGNNPNTCFFILIHGYRKI